MPYIQNIGSACLRKYKITEIEVWYSSKLEGTINMGAIFDNIRQVLNN